MGTNGSNETREYESEVREEIEAETTKMKMAADKASSILGSGGGR